MSAVAQRVAVVLLERHPGTVEPHGGNGVTEDAGEEVVGRAVVVAQTLEVEPLGDRRRVSVEDPVVGGVRGLVVLGVGVRGEEVVLVPELVCVDEEHGRVLAQQLHLAVGLRLGPREPIPVHVEAVGVTTDVAYPAIGVLRRHDHDDGVVEDGLNRAVGAVGQLVQHLECGVRTALLVAVHVGRDPQDRRG